MKGEAMVTISENGPGYQKDISYAEPNRARQDLIEARQSKRKYYEIRESEATGSIG